MSDLLTSLAARSLGVAPAIRPRTAALFETVDAGASMKAAAQPQEDERVVDIPSSSSKNQEQPLFKSERPTRALRTESLAVEYQSRVVPGSETVNQSGVRSPAESLVVSPKIAVRSSDADSSGSDRDRRHTPEASSQAKAENSADRPQEHSATFAEARETMVEDPQTPSHFSQRSFPDALVVTPDVSGEIAAELQRALIHQDSGPRRRDEPTAVIDARPDSRHDPQVTVTIGRVDVRAIAEPKTAARARQVSPVMSLDEYLLRGARGGGQ